MYLVDTRDRGFGQIAHQGITIGASTGAGIAAAIAAPGALSFAALAVPIIGGVAAVAGLVYAWSQRRGAQKVAATQIVDEGETYLKQNLAAYQAGSHTAADQATAVATFDAIWGQVRQACGDPQLGDAGRRCVQERQSGGVWDWFAAYRTPIASDVPSAAGGSPFAPNALAANILAQASAIDPRWLLLGALVLAGVVLL
jgi:hypothetical protein